MAIRVNGVTFSAIPTWTTSSNLSGNNNLAISIQLQATLAATYALAAGSTLPTGLTLTSGGLLSGTITGLTQETVYSFTVVAIDSENQDSPRTFTLTITVSDPYYKLVTLHLPGNGTNNAQNNTFLDSSSNNFTITRSGNTTQGTFSPFSQTGWGNYFNGSGDYLTAPTSSGYDFATGDFTIELWICLTALPSADIGGNRVGSVLAYTNGTANQGWEFFVDKTSNILQFASWGTGNAIQCNFNCSIGVWYHIVAARSSGTNKLYIDGVSQTLTTNSLATNTASSATLRIGASRGSANYNHDFPGYLSNVRIVKGRAVYTSNFTPLTSPLTRTTGGQNPPQGTETSLLTCQSNRFLDSNGPNTPASSPITITPNGSPSIQAFSPFNPTSSWSAATNGGSGYFDGSGDYLTVPDNSAWAFSGDFTIEAWVYPIVTNSENPIVAQWGGPGNANFIFMYTSGNRLRLGQTNTTITGSTTSIYINQWSHVAVTRSGSTIRLFVNGVLDGTTGTISGAFLNSTNPLTIGSLDGGGIPLTSYISGVRILNGTALYTTSFTPSTAPLTNITNTSLLLNFTNAGIYDATSKNDLETVGTTAISTAQSKWGGGSMYFDGNGDYLKAPTSNLVVLRGDWTLECWVYLNTVAAAQMFFDTRAVATDAGYAFYMTGSSKLALYTNNTSILVSTNSISASVWTHVAMSRQSNTIRAFINGNLDPTTASYSAVLNCIGSILVGSEASGSSQLSGYMQDLRITNGVARYTTNFTAPTSAFQTL